MKKKSIIQHIYEHPFGLIIHGEKDKWYSLRAMGENSYWIETEQGEGTEVNQLELYKIIDKFFKDNM